MDKAEAIWWEGGERESEYEKIRRNREAETGRHATGRVMERKVRPSLRSALSEPSLVCPAFLLLYQVYFLELQEP